MTSLKIEKPKYFYFREIYQQYQQTDNDDGSNNYGMGIIYRISDITPFFHSFKLWYQESETIIKINPHLMVPLGTTMVNYVYPYVPWEEENIFETPEEREEALKEHNSNLPAYSFTLIFLIENLKCDLISPMWTIVYDYLNIGIFNKFFDKNKNQCQTHTQTQTKTNHYFGIQGLEYDNYSELVKLPLPFNFNKEYYHSFNQNFFEGCLIIPSNEFEWNDEMSRRDLTHLDF